MVMQEVDHDAKVQPQLGGWRRVCCCDQIVFSCSRWSALPILDGFVEDFCQPRRLRNKHFNDVQSLQDTKCCVVVGLPVLMLKCLELIDVDPIFHVDAVMFFL